MNLFAYKRSVIYCAQERATQEFCEHKASLLTFFSLNSQVADIGLRHFPIEI